MNTYQIGALVVCILLSVCCVFFSKKTRGRLFGKEVFWVYGIFGFTMFLISVWGVISKIGHDNWFFQWPLLYDASYPDLIAFGGIGLGLIGVADSCALSLKSEKSRTSRKN
jgi:hypothetical protein